MMLSTGHRNKLIKAEDVLFTGLIPQSIGINRTHQNGYLDKVYFTSIIFLMIYFVQVVDWCMFDVISIHNISIKDFLHYWNALQAKC